VPLLRLYVQSPSLQRMGGRDIEKKSRSEKVRAGWSLRDYIEERVKRAAPRTRCANDLTPGTPDPPPPPSPPAPRPTPRIRQDFLALWKDADPDIPILKHAKAEYARLQ